MNCRALFVFLVRFYQCCLSPLKGASCRFSPTCSEYMIQAIQRYGVVKGIARGAWRILRCQPFNSGGHDPVD